MSQFGGGRGGCFSAVGIAHELLTSPDPNPLVWEHEANILDQVNNGIMRHIVYWLAFSYTPSHTPTQVIRGIRQCRPGLVETQQQYEHCHLILEHIITSRANATSDKLKKKKVGKKWNIFRRKQHVSF